MSHWRCEIRFLDSKESGNGSSKLMRCSLETLMRATPPAAAEPGNNRTPLPPSSLAIFSNPDPELCEPRQREQSGDSCEGVELWHHYPSEGEDTGRCLQEHALFSATTCCRHGSWYDTYTLEHFLLQTSWVWMALSIHLFHCQRNKNNFNTHSWCQQKYLFVGSFCKPTQYNCSYSGTF